jgi:hypothetical protein
MADWARARNKNCERRRIGRSFNLGRSYDLQELEGAKKERKESNVPARVDGSKIGSLCSGENVELCIEKGRERVPEAGEDGVLGNKVVPEGLKARDASSRAKVQLSNAEDKDGERRDEEEESSDTSRTDWEPGPEQARTSHGKRDEPACCKTDQGSTGESAVQGRSEEVAVWTSCGRRLDRSGWIHGLFLMMGARQHSGRLVDGELLPDKTQERSCQANTVSVSIPRRHSLDSLRIPRGPCCIPGTNHQPPTTVATHIIVDTNSHVVPEIPQPRRQDTALPTDLLRDRSNIRIAQPTTWRRSDDPEYQDDPEFNTFTTDLSDRLFSLTANISRLSSQVALLGTKRETDRVRERVQDLLEETSASFKDIGDGLKKVQAWHDLGVCSP